MLTAGEQTALEAIELQLEPINREITEIEERLAMLRKSKARLEAARVALAGAPNGKGKAGRKASKPYARKETVMNVCLDIAKQNAPIPKADLEALVKDKLGDEQGFSLSGVQLRLRECLAGDTFEVTENGMVSLATTPATQS